MELYILGVIVSAIFILGGYKLTDQFNDWSTLGGGVLLLLGVLFLYYSVVGIIEISVSGIEQCPEGFTCTPTEMGLPTCEPGYVLNDIRMCEKII